MDNSTLDRNRSKPLYVQIYDYFKTEIQRGNLREGEKLPSIREHARELSVSKITVEKAYDQLYSEGYIESAQRSRYTVAASGAFETYPENPISQVNIPEREYKKFPYDFSSGEMDPQGFDFLLWKRYLGKAVGEPHRLMHYGDVQGEKELRAEVARYIHRSRGVQADAGQIIIGPSVQSLLGILCSLLKPDHDRIAFEDPGFKNGWQVFADHNFRIEPIRMKSDGIQVNDLLSSGVRMVYLSPSHQFPTGLIMPVGKRNQLLSWASEVDGLVIEDDYDSEFRYYGSPIPAMKGLDGAERVIYLGSFSKIMPPSLRIAYMLLPQRLLQAFHQQSTLYNQTASTVEQLALASFMADGNLEKQIRRLRKQYQKKRQSLLSELQEQFCETVSIQDTGSGLFIVLDLQTPLSVQELKERAEAAGCRVAFMQAYTLNPHLPISASKQLILYFSSLPAEEIKQAVFLLKKAWSVRNEG